MFRDEPSDSEITGLAGANPGSDSRWAVVTGAESRERALERDVPGALQFAFRTDSPRDVALHASLHRLRAIAPALRTIGVFEKTWAPHGDAVFNAGGQHLSEPAFRGSAASYLLAASYILEYDPKATLLLHPVHYVVHPEERFQGYLLRLCLLAELFHDQIVVLGAAPAGTERDCSWVVPGGIKSPSLWAGAGPNPLGMVSYHDRPNGDEAGRLFQEGALINTGICAVKVKTLWKLAWATLPESMRHFDAFRQVLHAVKKDAASPADEDQALHHLYDRIPTLDFSSHVLRVASESLTVLPMDDVSWSDHRNPERMMEIIHRAAARWTRPWELAAHEG